jgi:hypothetical protein
MNKTTLWAVAALGLGISGLGFVAGPAKAADLGVFGAYQDTKDAQHGYGGGAKLDFSFLELRASYFNDVTGNHPLPLGGDFKLRVIPLEAGLVYKFAPNETFTPYLGGGASYFLLDTNRGNINNELGWYGVAGADIKTDHGFGIMAEAIYRSVDATVRDSGSSTTISNRADVQLRGFGANVGLVWHF